MPETKVNERRFYQPSRTSVERAAKLIAARAASQNMRTLVVHSDEAVLNEINDSLWQEPGFLTAVLAGDENEADAQIVLASQAKDGFDCQLICNDKETACESLLICYIFGKDDELTKKIRRVQWTEWRASGALLTYWTETDKGWEKTSEVNAPSAPTTEE